MKRRTFLQSCAGGVLVLVADPKLKAHGAGGAAELDQAFRNPPPTAYAKTWWHWMNGNISEIGITRDMEAMKRVGVGGFQIFQVGSGIPKGPVDYGSPEHVRLLAHAAKEADRLGLEFAMHNCPGWSSSGGPWITERPEYSMQTLTWTETPVTGGQRVNIALRQPPSNRNYYRDALVLAVPAVGGDVVQPIRITSNSGPLDPSALAGTEGVEIRATTGNAFLQLEFADPIEARSVGIVIAAVVAGGRGEPGGGGGGRGAGGGAPQVNMWLEASDDGTQFRKVADFPAVGAGGRGGGGGGTPALLPTTLNIPVTRARIFRLVCTEPRRVRLFQVSTTSRNANWTTKAQFAAGGRGGGPAAAVSEPSPSGAFIDPNTVLDITQSMNGQGQLDWQAPAGAWFVYRIGHTTNGTENHPSPDGGGGLECDKLSAEAYDYHFNSFYGKLFDAMAPLAKKGLAASIIDSYETGVQNWTVKLPDEFRKRRGYDMKPYMPAMFGRLVASPEITDRFLWDLRKTTAELMNENYYGRFAQDLHAHGMRAFNEPYSPGNFDEMQAGSYTDMVMGEFWQGRAIHHGVKLAASVGHIYDKKVIAAEAFTAQSKWQEHPYNLKTLGDYTYALGLNNYVFHRYAHQPHTDVVPGMTMGPWGWHFDRTNSWFEKAGGWLKGYVARCQNMLRQGVFVGDVLYFNGEDSPVRTQELEQLQPPLPPGYDWDSIDAGAIQTRVKIDNGRIVLPSGVSYRVLVVRDTDTMTLPLMQKIRDLVNQGMVLVVNSRLQRTPGLANYINADTQLRQLVSEVWGDLNGTTVTERTFGRGRVFWGQPLRTVMEKIGVKPDFEFTAKSGDAPINWIHRLVGGADVYFVSTRRRQAEDLVCTFRVNGKQPEFWDAVTGEMIKAAAFQSVDGRTRVPVHLEKAGSMFVVFRSAAPAQGVHQIAKAGAPLIGTQPFSATAPGLHRNVVNNFTISVWVKPDMEGTVPVVSAQPPVAGGPGGGGGGGQGGSLTHVIYPPAGETLYGANHAACGLGATRNGVAVYERSTGNPALVATAQVLLAGWTHVAVVYRDGTPGLYVDGKPVGQVRKSGMTVHPGLGESTGAPYDFLGQATEPQLFGEVLTDARIQQLAAAGLPAPEGPPAVEFTGTAAPELQFWEDGNYSVRHGSGGSSAMQISGIGRPVELSGSWTVRFEPDRGAPPQITLPALTSLHRHDQAGVKYFSGVATYVKSFNVPASAIGSGKRLYLDLGRVEVVADVKVNGKPAGNVWKPPYRLDITDLVRTGNNDLEVEVATLWPNRLIGDEQFPAEYEYGGGGGAGAGGGGGGGGAAAGGAAATGPITRIPDWYAKGQPKPPSPRITFTTYKWYNKNDPLFESGLLGPVLLRTAIRRPVKASPRTSIGNPLTVIRRWNG